MSGYAAKALLAALVAVIAGCNAGTSIGVGSDAGAPDASTGGGGAGPSECVLPPQVADRWPGWHRWPYTPCDCHVFVPDDIATVPAPPWEPCPYMPQGCTRATAPWAREWGQGYGHGVLEVKVHAGHEYLTVHRYAPAPDLWTDSMLLRGQELIGIWRSNVSDINSECSARGPLFAGDGQAALSAIRAEHETEPHVFTSPLDAMSEAPARIEVFAPPGPLPIPTGRVTRSNRLMVMWEHYGRFTVRDLQTGKTYRPEPPVSGEMHDPFPIGDKVVYWVFGPKRSVWVWSVDGESQPLLLDDAYSYDRFVTDGTDAVWIRGQNPIGANSYEVAELWTAPLALEPGALEPRKLVTLPGNGTRNTSVGDGWGATGMSYFGMPPFQDIRLYRLSDGAEKRLPVVEGYGWDSGQYAGLVIDGGAVWVRSLRDPGNDVRFITRFDIDALPDGPASP